MLGPHLVALSFTNSSVSSSSLSTSFFCRIDRILYCNPDSPPPRPVLEMASILARRFSKRFAYLYRLLYSLSVRSFSFFLRRASSFSLILVFFFFLGNPFSSTSISSSLSEPTLPVTMNSKNLNGAEMIAPRTLPIPPRILSASFPRGSINFSLNISPKGLPTCLSTVLLNASVILDPILIIESLMDLPAFSKPFFKGSDIRFREPTILSWNQPLTFLPISSNFFENGIRSLSLTKFSAPAKIPPLRFLTFFFSPVFSSTTSSSSSVPKISLLNLSALAIPVAAPRNPRIGPPGSIDRPGSKPIPEIKLHAPEPANAPTIVAGANFFS